MTGARGKCDPATGDVPMRACARVACAEAAKHTLTADYGDRMMAVGPLSPERTPSALDLCDRHREALTPPAGWQLIAHTVDALELGFAHAD